MRKTLGIIALSAALLGGGAAGYAASTSTPPPDPGPFQPLQNHPDCYRSGLDRHIEKRSVTIGGHRFYQFRTVATSVRWCPLTSYSLYVWKSQWGPGRR